METDWLPLGSGDFKAKLIDIPRFNAAKLEQAVYSPFDDLNFAGMIAFGKKFISLQGLIEYREVPDKADIKCIKTFYLVKDVRTLYRTIVNFGIIDSARSCYPEYYFAYGVSSGTELTDLKGIIRDHSLSIKKRFRGDALAKDSLLYTAIYVYNDPSKWYLAKSDFKGNVRLEKV